MEPDHKRRLALTIAAWPEGTHLDPERGQGTCIEVARFLVDTLRRLGLDDAKAMACDVVFANAAARGLEGVPLARWPDDAHSCGAGVDAPGGGSAQEPGRRKGFGGHVVVVGDDWLVDLTAQQFHRPEHGIVVDGPVLAGGLDGIGSKTHHELTLELPSGGWCRYVTRPEVKSYRTTNAWRSEAGVAAVVDVLTAEVLRRESEATVAG